MCPFSCLRTNKTSENDQTDINTTSRSQLLLPTTRKVDEAGQTRRTLPIFQTFFNIENEEGSTFGKHEPLLPPLWSSVSSPSERPRIFHISSWKKLGEKSGVTGWIEAKKTPPKWKKCSTVTGVNRRPPPPSCEDTSDTYEKGGWTTLFPRTTGWHIGFMTRTKLHVSVVRIRLSISAWSS